MRTSVVFSYIAGCSFNTLLELETDEFDVNNIPKILLEIENKRTVPNVASIAWYEGDSKSNVVVMLFDDVDAIYDNIMEWYDIHQKPITDIFKIAAMCNDDMYKIALFINPSKVIEDARYKLLCETDEAVLNKSTDDNHYMIITSPIQFGAQNVNLFKKCFDPTKRTDVYFSSIDNIGYDILNDDKVDKYYIGKFEPDKQFDSLLNADVDLPSFYILQYSGGDVLRLL